MFGEAHGNEAGAIAGAMRTKCRGGEEVVRGDVGTLSRRKDERRRSKGAGGGHSQCQTKTFPRRIRKR